MQRALRNILKEDGEIREILAIVMNSLQSKKELGFGNLWDSVKKAIHKECSTQTDQLLGKRKKS